MNQVRIKSVGDNVKNINNCVLVEWFAFRDKCPVKTCKFNSQVLKTGCLALERKDTFGKKLLTDRELRYYKFENSVHVSAVTAHRKKVLSDVKKVIALYYYVQYVLNNCTMLQVEPDQSARKLLKKFPAKLKKINITPVLLANMLIESNFEQYKKSVKLEEEYKLNDLFLIPYKKWSLYKSKVEN